jgi:3-oxoadipate enol-lactonase
MSMFFETPRLRIHARVEGTGPKLLFLGGSNFDLGVRAPVFDSDLVRHFTVAAADPRGLGRTQAPDGDWTMADYAADAVALLDALKWDRVFVVGESFGGMTALHLALLAPDRISRIAASVCAPGGPGGQSYPIQTFLEIADPDGRAAAALAKQDRRFLDLRAEQAQAAIAARVAQETRFMAHADNAAGYPRLLAARAGHDCAARIGQINQPTLVLAGRFDDQAPLALSHRMVADLPNGVLSEHDAGHGLLFTDPSALAAVLDHLTQGHST